MISRIRSLAINPLDPDQLIAGTWAGGSVFATNDGGATWEYAGKGIEPTHVRSVAYNPANPGLVYAGQREGGLRYKQTSVADSVWQAFPEQVLGGWQDFSVILAIAISPKDGRTIFVGVEGAGVLRSLDGGVSWKIVDNGLLAVPVTAVEADGADASHLFASTYGAGVFQSLDSGVSWSRHTWATPWDWALGMAVDTAGSQLFVLTNPMACNPSLRAIRAGCRSRGRARSRLSRGSGEQLARHAGVGIPAPKSGSSSPERPPFTSAQYPS